MSEKRNFIEFLLKSGNEFGVKRYLRSATRENIKNLKLRGLFRRGSPKFEYKFTLTLLLKENVFLPK